MLFLPELKSSGKSSGKLIDVQSTDYVNKISGLDTHFNLTRLYIVQIYIINIFSSATVNEWTWKLDDRIPRLEIIPKFPNDFKMSNMLFKNIERLCSSEKKKGI